MAFQEGPDNSLQVCHTACTTLNMLWHLKYMALLVSLTLTFFDESAATQCCGDVDNVMHAHAVQGCLWRCWATSSLAQTTRTTWRA